MGKRALLLLVLLTTLSCHKSDPTQPGFAVVAVSFTTGRASEYAWAIGERDSAGNFVPTVTDTFVVRVGGTTDTVATMSQLIRLEAYSVHELSMVMYAWYAQTVSDLRDVAYSGAGHVPVVQPVIRGTSASVRGWRGSARYFAEPYLVGLATSEDATGSDSIIVRSDPRIVYQYPMTPGLQWQSFAVPFLQTREVIGEEIVTVPAGTFLCLRVRTRIPDLAPDLVWDDLVSTDGLVQRNIEMKLVSYDATMTPGDTLVSVERMDLVQK